MNEQTFDVHDREALARWWELVQEHARSTVQMETGSRLYVRESFEVLALMGPDFRYHLLHIVSTASGSQYEMTRSVHVPPLARLIPADKIASIAPVVDQ